MADEEWKPHDGKGVPADAIPGVTIVRRELPKGSVVWRAGLSDVGPMTENREPWDWENFGKPTGRPFSRWGRITHYRNPRAASTETGMAILKAILPSDTVEVEIVRKSAETPRKVRVKG